MRNTLGHESSLAHSCTLKPYEYKPTQLIITIDIEQLREAGFTGLNTRAGDLLTVKFKCNTPAAGGAVNAQRVANLMHIVLRSDHILEIHDTGVRVFD